MGTIQHKNQGISFLKILFDTCTPKKGCFHCIIVMYIPQIIYRKYILYLACI